jgi:hypothetical protein
MFNPRLKYFFSIHLPAYQKDGFAKVVFEEKNRIKPNILFWI